MYGTQRAEWEMRLELQVCARLEVGLNGSLRRALILEIEVQSDINNREAKR